MTTTTTIMGIVTRMAIITIIPTITTMTMTMTTGTITRNTPTPSIRMDPKARASSAADPRAPRTSSHAGPIRPRP